MLTHKSFGDERYQYFVNWMAIGPAPRSLDMYIVSFEEFALLLNIASEMLLRVAFSLIQCS